MARRGTGVAILTLSFPSAPDPMRLVLVALAVLLALPARAQTADPVERLADALSLTADQADLVAEVYNQGDPASVWTLTSELLPTLTADQRQALMARPVRPAGGDRAQRQRGQGRRGQGGRGGAPRERDPAREAVLRAARDAALGLDADQSEQLDEALERMSRREMMRSLRDGEMPDAVSNLLTADQIEMWQAQMMLQRRLRMRGPRPSDP